MPPSDEGGGTAYAVPEGEKSYKYIEALLFLSLSLVLLDSSLVRGSLRRDEPFISAQVSLNLAVIFPIKLNTDYLSIPTYAPSLITMPLGDLETSPVVFQVMPVPVRPSNLKEESVNCAVKASHISAALSLAFTPFALHAS